MDQPSDISRLLTLRKVTRAVAELLGEELRTHMATLAPLLRPRDVLGRHLRGNEKQPVRGDTEAFEELRSLYQELAGKGTWSLPKTLESPVDILHASIELVPAEYAYEIGGIQPSKTVRVISPLRWVLAYSGFGPRRLRELMAGARTSATRDLQECIVQFLVLHLTLSRRSAVIGLLESLRFPVSLCSDEEFDGLPLYTVSGPISTLRPADEVILQGTELSGTDVFEEVVNLDDIAQLRDPLRERLAELVSTDV